MDRCCQYRFRALLILRFVVAVCSCFHIPFLLPLWAADIFLRVLSDTLRVVLFVIVFVLVFIVAAVLGY